MNQPIVVLVQPIYGVVPGIAHAHQMEFLGANIARGFCHGYHARLGAYIDEARNFLVETCLDQYKEATHLFFVDQDMILPGDTLKTLLIDNLQVVSAVYFGKDDKCSLVGWQELDPPKRLDTFEPDKVAPVAGFGLGACLIRTELLRAMAEFYNDREWFKSERSGEDMHFSRRLAGMGLNFWLNGRVQCGHVGDMVVTADHWRVANGETHAAVGIS